LSLSERGVRALDDASRQFAAGEAMEAEALAHWVRPRGVVRVTAPMSFGLPIWARSCRHWATLNVRS